MPRKGQKFDPTTGKFVNADGSTPGRRVFPREEYERLGREALDELNREVILIGGADSEHNRHSEQTD